MPEPTKTPKAPPVVGEPLHSDVVIDALKRRYFDVVSKERIGETPKLTAEADQLEKAIREVQRKR